MSLTALLILRDLVLNGFSTYFKDTGLFTLLMRITSAPDNFMYGPAVEILQGIIPASTFNVQYVIFHL